MSSFREVPLLPFTSAEVLSTCQSFKDSDMPTLFLASYPKSGTTWLQCIVYHMLMRGDSHCEERLSHISHFSPFYEHHDTWIHRELKPEVVRNHFSLGQHVFNTHLLPWMLPLTEPTVKAIYITRRPRSVATSFYHHLHNQLDQGGGFEESFLSFLTKWFRGDLPYGTWAEHVSDWLRAPERVLLLEYEDLIDDLPAGVRSIALFLGLDLTEEEVHFVASRSSFSAMKNNSDKFQPISVRWRPGFSFIRKGVVDDRGLFDTETEAIFDEELRQLSRIGSLKELSKYFRL